MVDGGLGTRQRLWLHDVNVLNATGLIVFKGLIYELLLGAFWVAGQK